MSSHHCKGEYNLQEGYSCRTLSPDAKRVDIIISQLQDGCEVEERFFNSIGVLGLSFMEINAKLFYIQPPDGIKWYYYKLTNDSRRSVLGFLKDWKEKQAKKN